MRLKSSRRTRYLVGAAGIAVVAAVSVALLTVGGARGAPAETVLATFNVPGTYSWTVPTGVRRVIFDVYGAAGGNVVGGDFLISEGGLGGEAKGIFTVKPGQTFMIVVGGRGGNSTGPAGGAGGFNGGGWGAKGFETLPGGAGGGGGSDVRIGGHGTPCVSDLSCSFGGRIIGGGGGGGGAGHQGADGGVGGGLEGGPGELGGGQDRPGFAPFGGRDGAFFFGGDCRTDSNLNGGGGGGWWGGACDSLAGGGSGFVSHFARKGSFPGGVRAGDGLVVISTP